MAQVTEEHFEELLREMREEFPRFEIIEKTDSRLMRLIDFLLKVITFGKMKLFMTHFLTTNGVKVYVPKGWMESRSPSARMISMRHERVHMRQKRPWGPLFSIAYLLLPLPIGLAWFRKQWEQEAYTESLRAVHEYWGEDALRSEKRRERYISHFVGPSYFWMWPFRKSVEEWYDRTVDDILAGS